MVKRQLFRDRHRPRLDTAEKVVHPELSSRQPLTDRLSARRGVEATQRVEAILPLGNLSPRRSTTVAFLALLCVQGGHIAYQRGFDKRMIARQDKDVAAVGIHQGGMEAAKGTRIGDDVFHQVQTQARIALPDWRNHHHPRKDLS